MNLAANYAEDSLQERFFMMDSDRSSKLDRARQCASLTIPQLLPPENWSEIDALPQPYSSEAGRGVVTMSSRILSALIPLNDMPFFQFSLKDGREADPDTFTLLETLSNQVYSKISGKNLRSTVFQALQSLVTVGDVLLIMNDDFSFRLIRLDQYQVRRDVKGEPREIIYLEYDLKDSSEPIDSDLNYTGMGQYSRKGYETLFCRWVKDFETDTWYAYKENEEGTMVDQGVYDVCPVIPLRWSGVISENYGRSHVEENYGDIQSLEAFTEAALEGQAAASSFWMVMNPTGPSELDDVIGQPNGAWLSVRPDDVAVLTPADQMRVQIQATAQAVQDLRMIIAKSFLNDGGQIRDAERVTAAEVRMVGQQLESVLGGAFSSIARDLMAPIVTRAVFLMIEEGELDPRIAESFTAEGQLDVDIVTGLQALSRDSDLQKLMQMGEMIRNLPEQAAAMFKWEEYGKALVAALGFDPRNWVQSQEEATQQQMEAAQQQAGIQAGAGAAQQAMGAAGEQAAQQAMGGGGSMMTPEMVQAGLAPGQGGM